MVNVLLALAGVACLVGFVVLWLPGGLLLAGLGLLWLALVRSENRKAVRK